MKKSLLLVMAVALALSGCADNADEKVIAGEEVIEVSWRGGVIGKYIEVRYLQNESKTLDEKYLELGEVKIFATVGEREWKKTNYGSWYFTIEDSYTLKVGKDGSQKRKVEGSNTRYDIDDEGQLVILYDMHFFPTTKEGVKAINAYMK